MFKWVSVMMLAVLLAPSASWATRTYPNDMDEFRRKYDVSRTNINPKRPKDADKDNDKGDMYPQGKNLEEIKEPKVVGGANQPTRPICIGAECSCSSVGHR